MSPSSKQGNWGTVVSIWVVMSLGPWTLVTAADSSDQPFSRTTPQCGHWAVLRSCQLLGVPAGMKDLMKLMPPEEQGHSMWMLLKSLKKVGLRGDGRLVTYHELTDGPFPVIAHIKPDHFIVVIGADDDFVALFDGYGRRKVWTSKNFRDRWTNKLLTVQRAPNGVTIPHWLPRPSQTAPHIQFETLLVDKGEIPGVGEGVDFVFPFRNSGGADLVIIKIKTDCVCMGSTKPEQAIPPGTQDRITLTYNVDKRDGPFSHTALVQTNDPAQPWIGLTGSGNTSKAVRMKPKYLDLGRIVSGETHTTTCFVKYTGDIPLEIVNVESPTPGMAVKWRILTKDLVERHIPAVPQSVVFIGRNARSLEISFTPALDTVGKIEEKLYIRTNIREFEQITLPVLAQVVRPVILAPDMLFLGEIGSQNSVDQTITAFSASGHPFKIVAVDTEDTGLQCVYPEDGSSSRTLRFHGRIRDPNHINDKTIYVHVELLDENEPLSIELPIYAKQR